VIEKEPKVLTSFLAANTAKPKRLVPERVLPAYRYLPGLLPHPIRSREGHMYGQQEPEPNNAHLLWSIDLFNEAYYWEAHEAFELLWKNRLIGSTERALFQGIILSAASSIKWILGQDKPAIRLGEKAKTKMSLVLSDDTYNNPIIDVSKTAENIRDAAQSGHRPFVSLVT